MTVDDRLQRFEELDAGRAFGDLDATEMAEWSALSAELGRGGNPSFDLLAAELEAASAVDLRTALPPELAASLKRTIPSAAAAPHPERKNNIVVISAWLGWALAACLLAMFVIPKLTPDRTPSLAEQRAALLDQAADAVQLSLTGAGGAYTAANGEVVWSDSRQEGYLTLANLPANNPAQNQYQLWIVDPSRDELPVDGGVFDIPQSEGPVVVPINAKLAVENPAAFVITLEQPGGVVLSKQETVVAIAKS